MKSLSLSRPLIIMTVGLPGAGKTRFSVQFSDMFTCPLVSYDRIRRELFNEPTFSDDEFSIIQRVADYQIQELLKTKKTIVVDGAANTRADRTVLRQMAHRHGYATLLVWVQTDPSTCEARSLAPRSAGEDTWRSPMPKHIFTDLCRRLQPPAVQEQYVVISGKHTYSAQARTVLKRLVPAESASTEVAKSHSADNPASQRPTRPPQPPASPTRRNVTIN